jgi:hypothetical protein
VSSDRAPLGGDARLPGDDADRDARIEIEELEERPRDDRLGED